MRNDLLGNSTEYFLRLITKLNLALIVSLSLSILSFSLIRDSSIIVKYNQSLEYIHFIIRQKTAQREYLFHSPSTIYRNEKNSFVIPYHVYFLLWSPTNQTFQKIPLQTTVQLAFDL